MKDATHARGAPTREEAEQLVDLDAEFLFGFYQCWKDAEDNIQKYQDQKKAMLANVRTAYGRHQAEALRLAMRRMFTDPVKREESDRFNELAVRYVDILETEVDARQFDDIAA